jgi:hypothetical protein
MKKEEDKSGCLILLLILFSPILILIEAAKKSK